MSRGKKGTNGTEEYEDTSRGLENIGNVGNILNIQYTHLGWSSLSQFPEYWLYTAKLLFERKFIKINIS